MTVIVGLPHKTRVYFGADSALSSGWSRIHGIEPKVWRTDANDHSIAAIIGVTGSNREAQIMWKRMVLPTYHGTDDLLYWLTVPFVDALRQTRKDAGHDEKKERGPEIGPHFMMGVNGRLFLFYSDYSFCEQPYGYAIGSGGDLAIGSLHTSRLVWKDPTKRIDAALKAACYNNAGCAPPFTYVNT